MVSYNYHMRRKLENEHVDAKMFITNKWCDTNTTWETNIALCGCKDLPQMINEMKF